MKNASRKQSTFVTKTSKRTSQQLRQEAQELRNRANALEEEAERLFVKEMRAQGKCPKCHCRLGADRSRDFAKFDTPAVGRFGVDICPCDCHSKFESHSQNE